MNPQCLKVSGGWRIKLESGKIFPKLYKTKNLCQIRVDQLVRHRNEDSNDKK